MQLNSHHLLIIIYIVCVIMIPYLNLRNPISNSQNFVHLYLNGIDVDDLGYIGTDTYFS